MSTPSKLMRDGMYVGLTLGQLQATNLSYLLRLAAYVGADGPKDVDPGAYRYRLACNVLRAIKRGR